MKALTTPELLKSHLQRQPPVIIAHLRNKHGQVNQSVDIQRTNRIIIDIHQNRLTKNILKTCQVKNIRFSQRLKHHRISISLLNCSFHNFYPKLGYS